jgi:hypothetical protein
MTNQYLITHPTGLFIPVEKQSLFMVAFEDMLISNHRIVPLFGQATQKNTSELQFKYLGNKSYKPGCFVSDVDSALVSYVYVLVNVTGIVYSDSSHDTRKRDA